MSKRYFCRLRQLLLTQFGAITARINKPSSSRRRTKVYIRFSYKKDITYFGFYLPCTHDLSSGPCNLPVSHCMSRVPQRCPLHYSDTNRTHIPITTPSRKSNDIPPFTHLGHEPKRVFIPRLNISFTKRFISDDLFYDHLDTQYIPLPSNKPHKHYFGIARTDLQINSQSPAQRKRWARSCYKTSQWIAELKTKRKSAGKKAKNTIDPPWVGCRFPLTPDTSINLGRDLHGVISFHKDFSKPKIHDAAKAFNIAFTKRQQEESIRTRPERYAKKREEQARKRALRIEKARKANAAFLERLERRQARTAQLQALKNQNNQESPDLNDDNDEDNPARYAHLFYNSDDNEEFHHNSLTILYRFFTGFTLLEITNTQNFFTFLLFFSFF